ncbi:MAG TPA: SDR family oxidoreductase [Burkholderiales bacterium]|nr:SDR family oxidoreductase [Burkholderiales bacterium]
MNVLSASIAQSDPRFHEALCANAPLGHIGAAYEFAAPVVFLLSDAPSYVAGTGLAINGGWMKW